MYPHQRVSIRFNDNSVSGLLLWGHRIYVKLVRVWCVSLHGVGWSLRNYAKKWNAAHTGLNTVYVRTWEYVVRTLIIGLHQLKYKIKPYIKMKLQRNAETRCNEARNSFLFFSRLFTRIATGDCVTAVGCPTFRLSDFVSASSAWTQQDSTTATVRCNQTDETWFLRCDGRQWKGSVGNCSVSSHCTYMCRRCSNYSEGRAPALSLV